MIAFWSNGKLSYNIVTPYFNLAPIFCGSFLVFVCDLPTIFLISRFQCGQKENEKKDFFLFILAYMVCTFLLLVFFVMLADIDECVSGVHNCHSSASCTNTVGSFNCSCNQPYTGDGKKCSLAAGKHVSFILWCCTMLDMPQLCDTVKRKVYQNWQMTNKSIFRID